MEGTAAPGRSSPARLSEIDAPAIDTIPLSCPQPPPIQGIGSRMSRRTAPYHAHRHHGRSIPAVPQGTSPVGLERQVATWRPTVPSALAQVAPDITSSTEFRSCVACEHARDLIWSCSRRLVKLCCRGRYSAGRHRFARQRTPPRRRPRGDVLHQADRREAALRSELHGRPITLESGHQSLVDIPISTLYHYLHADGALKEPRRRPLDSVAASAPSPTSSVTQHTFRFPY